MRRIVAAVATTVLVTFSAAGPAVAAPAQDPVYEISCGTIGDPICPVIDQVKTLLVPLAPVLAASQPLLGELGNGITALTQVLEMAPSIPAVQLAEATGQVLAQLGTATKPVLLLLSSLGLPADVLSNTIGQLDALVRHGIELFTQTLPGTAGTPLAALPLPLPLLTAEPAQEASPTPAPSSGSPVLAPSSSPSSTATATSSGTPSTPFRSRIAQMKSDRDNTPRTRSVTFRGVPANRSTLQLSPLGLPRIGTSAATGTVHAAAAPAVAKEAAMRADLAAALPDDGPGNRTTAVVIALLAVLLAAGLLIDQARSPREAVEP